MWGNALVDYSILEGTGWKAPGGTAIHPDNAQGRFYRAMLEAFSSEGSGCIFRYRFDDKVVAVDFRVEGNGVLMILKTTYDESMRTLSPAFLMRQEAFQPLFAEGKISRIESYGKLMEWHMRWTGHVRTLYHMNYYQWPWLAAMQRLESRRSRPRWERLTASQPLGS